MSLREGRTFAESAHDVVHDWDKFAEHMAKEPSSKTSPAKHRGANEAANKGGSKLAKGRPIGVPARILHPTPRARAMLPVRIAMALGALVNVIGGIHMVLGFSRSIPTMPNRDSTGPSRLVRYPTTAALATFRWLLPDLWFCCLSLMAYLQASVFAFASWEVDSECKAVVRAHFPHVREFGDIDDADTDAVAAFVGKADPDGAATVLLAAGPPCPDFSVVSSTARGRSGPEGRKLETYCSLVDDLVPKLGGRKVLHLCENVVFQQEHEVQHFSNRLGCSAVVIDAGDRGLVNRPRLYWTSIDWTRPHIHPITKEPLSWGRMQKLPRLFLGLPRRNTDTIEVPADTWFHPDITEHKRQIPRFTPPAPGSDGRAAPKQHKGELTSDVKARWLSDHRQYAPLALSVTCYAAILGW